MNLRIALSVADIVLLALVLSYFLIRIAKGLSTIASVLTDVAGGVVAIRSDTAILHPGADALNSNLNVVARNLTETVGNAQALTRG